MKIGVLGCSSIAFKAVIPAILNSKSLVLGGVASRRAERAALYASSFKTTPYSYESLLESDVDAIYVSVPVGLHHEWGRRVLEAGKHLLMEKTFTEKYSQAIELFELADENELVCHEALMYEFHPVQRQIEDLIHSVGIVRSVEAHFAFPHFQDKGNIRYNKELGGGATLDCLIYPLSFIFRLLGPSPDKFSRTIYKDASSGVDERGYIQFTYDDVVANLSYGFGHSYRNEIAIWGDAGILKAQRAFTRTPNCDDPIVVWSNGDYRSYEVEKADHFLLMLESFAKCAKDGDSNSLDTLDRLAFLERL